MFQKTRPLRGIDRSEVIPDRPTQSVSAEDTFEQDVPLIETEPMIRRLAEKTWTASRKELRVARTVVLKLKTSEFKILTRSHTPRVPPSSCEHLTNMALSLRDRITLSSKQRFRLVGVGLSNFHDPDERRHRSSLGAGELFIFVSHSFPPIAFATIHSPMLKVKVDFKSRCFS